MIDRAGLEQRADGVAQAWRTSLNGKDIGTVLADFAEAELRSLAPAQAAGMREALEAVLSEIALTGRLADLVDAALSQPQADSVETRGECELAAARTALREIESIGRKITDPRNTYGLQMTNIASAALGARPTPSATVETAHNLATGERDNEETDPTYFHCSAGIADDPTASKEWNEGCDFAMEQLCRFLGVDPSSVSWDAATETIDGDVQAVIGNILCAKFGEDWGPNDLPQEAASAGKRGMIRDHKLAQVKGWIDDPSDARAVECAKGVTDAIVLLERHGIIDWVTEPQAAQVSDEDLLNWIENEASRGLTEGDAREALTAIKWKIKDGR